ncbi:acetate/propionate family kinase [Pseudoduganella buxea]|uniref:Acetate kinase n=1 Tax=Pseudoduganella buxea TaxID=1949069 RepID=A0A6I3SXG1_9BURK|nr:acetate/propionate family kinase [Pseudoduganella buxea]MTV53256.1 acetate kinase [Pseudoduganella buxea]GGC13245.1 acetate kinase [Pseudoduganella buxea]
MDDTTRQPDSEALLLLNAGTASLKSAIFDACTPLPAQRPLWRGSVTDIGGADSRWRDSEGGSSDLAPAADPFLGAVACLLARSEAWLGNRTLRAIGYRLPVAGGLDGAALRLDDRSLDALEAAPEPVPRYQRDALRMARVVAARWPGVPQVASFDTWFHRTLPLAERMLPLPHRYWEAGLRRNGCHGLSFEYLAMMLPRRFGARARGRVIAAHLGSTASLCGMLRLRSVAVSPGLSPADGLMTGTGAGALPPEAMRHLLRELGDTAALDRLLHEEAGLLGVSGASADPQVLLRRETQGGPAAERAGAALALYVRQVVREVGAIAAVLGGLDILVFTGGVGEHDTLLRQRICAALGGLGVQLDARLDASNARCISPAGSTVTVAIEATCEEWVMSRDCMVLTSPLAHPATVRGPGTPVA